jgi:hypothetical protein
MYTTLISNCSRTIAITEFQVLCIKHWPNLGNYLTSLSKQLTINNYFCHLYELFKK